MVPDASRKVRPREPIAPARRAAFDLLLKLRQSPQAHSDNLLRSVRVSALSSVDRNLATALVMGVLRWKIALDERIATASKKTQALAAPVETALELGALQLLLLDRIPTHSAIFESVELAKQSGHAHAAGFVNAVLRKLAGSPKLVEESTPSASSEDSAEAIARRWAHPRWMVARWVRAYGLAAASAICRFDQYPPPVAVRLMAPHAEAALAEEGVHLQPGAFVERARRVVRGEVTSTRAFVQGWVRVQDEASQLIAELAGRGSAILDCCAAPGGKTEILAERNPQAAIVACDIHPGRLRTMRARLSKLAHTAHVSFRAIDIAAAPLRQFDDRQFDLVLCDAPCSGTGTLARNPEIRHRLAAGDLARQHERQVRILSAAMRALAKSGRLVYSTCSLEAEENEQVVESVLAAHRGFRLLSWKEPLIALEREGALRAGSAESLWRSPSESVFLRTIPGLQPCDGFFGALITRET